MIFIRKIIVSSYLLIALLLLAISYIIMHRNANCIKRYKKETTDLIGQLKHSVVQNESLIASRKKAVHAILYELRTPLTAITDYTALLDKEDVSKPLSLFQRHIFQLFQYILVGRTNNTLSFKVQFFIAMCAPAHDTGHCKQRSKDFLRQTNHFINKS
jgi:signal transduction histidine kinase